MGLRLQPRAFFQYHPQMTDSMVTIAARLRDRVEQLSFVAPVRSVYNPLRYAWEPHRIYLERFGRETGRVVLLGMNPGPWGMAQTGVPFGEVNLVRDWLGIEARVDRPQREHPKRPIEGFDCARSEVSGRRLWGWALETFGRPEAFFERFFVLNYCPLVFMEDSGRNRTPDKLSAGAREPLFDICDGALRDAVRALDPTMVIGVGRFAEKRARTALGDQSPPVGGILHPSPASPAANRGWAAVVERQLSDLGLDLPSGPGALPDGDGSR